MNMITTENVAAAFDEVAPSYDLMVALNPGYHAHLRAAADALVEWLPRPKPAGSAPLVRLLDLGCGSGASTRAVQLAAQAADVRFAIVGVDASAGMLEQAHGKRWPAGVRFEVGKAEEIAWSRDSWGLAARSRGRLRRTCSATSPIGTQCSRGSSSCSPTAACWSFRSTRLRDRVARGWSGLWCAGWWSFLLVG